MESTLGNFPNINSKITSVATADYAPLFYRATIATEKSRLNELIKTHKSLIIHNEIKGQLEELIKCKHPKKKFNSDTYLEYINSHLNNTHIDDYGVWVYYPWSNRLIHILDEEEFILVRTNRNQNKITSEEHEILKTKKIGIIGLSVGQSIALTIASERIAGEINIADFDTLELSNLNRIRTGIHNLNLPKTITVAREIAEIDPFIKVNCYHEGVTENNIDEFICKEKKLDLLIDECDGLSIKFLCRNKAKQHQIPVVMDTSDRGMIDIERFDLDPNRPIFHGLLHGLDISKLKEAKTNEEKVPYVMAIIGTETMSTKLKASMLEVEQTISSWPQLASSVTLGGGITCDVSRRILLDQFQDSGRYFVDVEDIIQNQLIQTTLDNPSELTIASEATTILDTNDNTSYNNEMFVLAKQAMDIYTPSDTTLVTKPFVQQLVAKAILAPTGGNSQPWKWLFTNNQLFLFQHQGKTNKFLDFNGYGTILGLGAATENLILEASNNNIEANINLFPLKSNESLVAQISFSKSKINNNYNYLANYINDRVTDRNIYPSETINSEVLNKLKDACNSISGAKLHLLTDKEDIKKYGEILGRSDKTLLTTKATHTEFMNEIRWTKQEVEETKTGVDLETIDLTATEITGFKLIKNWNVVKHLNRWGGGSAFEKLSKKCAESAFALGLITVPKLTQKGFFNGGRAMERVWLEATKNDVNLHPLSGLTYVFTRLSHGNAENMDSEMINEIKELRKKHENLFNTKNEVEVFFFRIFKGSKPVKRSLRKNIDDILIYEK